jgi:hypothetical protein
MLLCGPPPPDSLEKLLSCKKYLIFDLNTDESFDDKIQNNFKDNKFPVKFASTVKIMI